MQFKEFSFLIVPYLGYCPVLVITLLKRYRKCQEGQGKKWSSGKDEENKLYLAWRREDCRETSSCSSNTSRVVMWKMEKTHSLVPQRASLHLMGLNCGVKF